MPKRSKRLFAAFAFIVLAGVFFIQRHAVHPEFGRISESVMAERPSVWQQAKYSFRKLVHLPNEERMWLLSIGSTPLQWSSGGAGKGFIYTNHPLLDDTPLWEFAFSQHSRLSDVHRTDLPSDYFGMHDARGSNVFGADWAGHAIRVPDGQVFFARLVTNRAVVYVVRLADRGIGEQSGRMRVEYVTVKQQ
jgi:hypothetical protein